LPSSLTSTRVRSCAIAAQTSQALPVNTPDGRCASRPFFSSANDLLDDVALGR
jgi:hypothetical protein